MHNITPYSRLALNGLLGFFLSFLALTIGAQTMSTSDPQIEKKVLEACPGSFIVADKAPHRLPGTVTVIFRGIESEAVLTLLDMQGVYASSGSACSTGSKNPSHVLYAMGVDYTLANSALRFSLSRYNTEEDVDYVIENMPPIVDRLRKLSPFV